MKQWMVAFLAVASSLTAQQGGNSSPAQPGAAHTQPNMQDPCSGLSATEQHFAKQLNPQNRALFCAQFTPAQRQAAMLQAAEPDATGNLISADQAVEDVASASPTPAPTSPTPPSSSQGSGMPQGCPT